jgi:hypothetical protein
MAVAELSVGDFEAEAVLAAYSDEQAVAGWAREAVAANVAFGIVRGRSESELAPDESMTRAEAAVIIQRLLQQADFIQ